MASLYGDWLVDAWDQRPRVGEHLLLRGEQACLRRGQADGAVGPGEPGGLGREPERAGEVAAGAPPVGADVRFGDPEALLDDADERGVIEHVGADLAACRPGR